MNNHAKDDVVVTNNNHSSADESDDAMDLGAVGGFTSSSAGITVNGARRRDSSSPSTSSCMGEGSSPLAVGPMGGLGSSPGTDSGDKVPSPTTAALASVQAALAALQAGQISLNQVS